MRLLKLATLVLLLSCLRYGSANGCLGPQPSVAAARLSCTGTLESKWCFPKRLLDVFHRKKVEEEETPVEIPFRKRMVDAARVASPRLFEIVAASEGTVLAASYTKQKPTKILVAINLFVNALWQCGAHDAELFRFMDRHFIRYSHNWKEKMHTILLSGFSHQSKTHLASNMAALQLVGPKVCKRLGSRNFSYFYVTALYAADLFDAVLYSPKFAPRTKKFLFFFTLRVGSLGASGAIAAILTYYCLKFPKERVDVSKLFSISEETRKEGEKPSGKVSKSVRLPAWIVWLAVVLSDLLPEQDSNVANGAHLGGHIFGAIVYIIGQMRQKNVWKRLFSLKKQSIWSRMKRCGNDQTLRSKFARWNQAALLEILGACRRTWCAARMQFATAFNELCCIVDTAHQSEKTSESSPSIQLASDEDSAHTSVETDSECGFESVDDADIQGEDLGTIEDDGDWLEERTEGIVQSDNDPSSDPFDSNHDIIYLDDLSRDD